MSESRSSKPGGRPGSSPRGRRPGESWRDYRRRRRSFLWRWRRALFLAGLVFVSGIATAGYWLASIELPPVAAQAETTFVYDVNGNVLAELHAEEDRVLVTLEQVPKPMIDAVIAAEDRDFFRHPGVDPMGIARAAWADIRNQSFEQGGSTITQQLVKNRFLSNDRTLIRKVREAVLAVRLEQDREKADILEDYLNTVYFGRGAYGVQAAAQAYFGLDSVDLGLREAAYLAGLIRAPESADVDRDPAAANRRRSTVLDAMREEGYITAAEYDQVASEPVEAYTRQRAAENESVEVKAGADVGSQYFVEYVRSQLSALYGDALVFSGGLRVHTSLDLDMQRAAFEAVHEVLDREDDPEAGLVAIDDAGLIRAMYGGDSWPESKVNLAVGRDGGGSGRQPGSAFKPIVLAEFLDQGFSIRSRFNAPSRIRIELPGEDWEPRNYGNSGYGVIDLLTATQKSVNTAYAQVIEEVGPDKAVEMARKLGVRSDLPEVLSLVLGGGEVSVLDMASAYSTFMNRGVHVRSRAILRVEDASGRVIDDFEPDPSRVLSEETADTITHALERVVSGGTGTRARLRGHDVAGKTGTTNNNKDAWFVGYTPKLTAAVWMGFVGAPGEDVPEMTNVHGRRVTGGSFPAEIWRVFMTKALEGVDTGSFPPPPSRFEGEVLGARLVQSTDPPATNPPEETESTSSTTPDGSSSSSTTTPDPSSTTTSAPDSSTTSTTALDPSTSVTAPSSSTTTSTPPPSTTG